VITKNILNNSGVEFIARSAAKETEIRLTKIIDTKVDKSAFEIILSRFDNLEQTIRELKND